jgi:hypothetical protein
VHLYKEIQQPFIQNISKMFPLIATFAIVMYKGQADSSFQTVIMFIKIRAN